jgi:predicted short-subunit dehydrogenase-like oxidoreductase (DUF2520 family)
MQEHPIRKVVILGAGRLATNLGAAIRKKGYEIPEVYNRTSSKGIKLSRRLGATYIPDPELLTTDADLYILAVSDDAIGEVLSKMSPGDRLIVHTSGAVAMGVLAGHTSRYGVLYPPQTFDLRRLTDFRQVPLCIEAGSPETLELLFAFASSLSEKVYRINSDQRKVLHLCAVFANNFTNFMYVISQDLLKESGMDFRMLEPIIRHTAARASKGDALKMQTGPAFRGDTDTIRKHLELLSGHPEYKEIYQMITQKIIQRKKEDDKL